MLDLQERLIRIVDPDDPRVAPFRNIRERDLVGRQGRFIAEGRVVLRSLAVSKRFEADAILLLENRVAGLADLLERFNPDIPVLVCGRDVIDQIAGFPMHRGVLAVGRSVAPATLSDRFSELGDEALVLVCAGISNHDNLGSLFRNASAFCADFVCLDEQCCDPLYRKSIRVSVGTTLTMPYVTGGDVGDIVSDLEDAGFDVLALSPTGQKSVERLEPGRRTALIVGTEGEGLPADLLKQIQTIRIAQSPALDSLNVSMAAGIALHMMAGKKGRIE